MRKLAFLLVCLLALPAAGQPWAGSGTEGDPYQIWDACDMQAIGANSVYWDAHFELMADIDLGGYAGTQFNIIGSSSPYFSGVFDGNDYQITRFTYIDKTKPRVGVFGRTTENSEIRNVYLVDVNVCGYYDVGGLVGTNYGKIENCSVSGVIVASEDFGGLVGENRGWIERCNADVTIQNYGPLSSYVGCLVGWNMEGDIIDCSSAGIVYGNDSADKAGGLVGSNSGRIKRCYSTADVQGSWCIGGLVGVHDSYNLENCYATGNVLAVRRGGGLVGFSTHTVINCYATGDVNCTRAAGGLIGEEGYGGAMNCYSKGYVIGNQDVGGLVGLKYTTDGFAGCFWDVNTSGEPNSAGGTGLTTTEMQDANTFIDVGWDFNTPIWKFCSVPNYPSLWWEECPVLEPVEMIAELLEEVAGLELPSGIENGLEAKLEASLGALDDENENNDVAAINTLEAFINAVEAQRGKKIPEAEADALIAAAQGIIELLSDG